MYMTLRQYRVPAGQMDEVIRRVDDNWLDRVRVLPGFVSYHVVREAEDQLRSVTVFTDEMSAKAAVEASAEWVGERLQDLDVTFVDMHQGPVVVHGGS
jgi:heme-degrading monooxygenase HmoA